MRLQFMYISTLVILLAMLNWVSAGRDRDAERDRERSGVICNIFQVYQAAAQAADTYSGEEDTTQREKSWFPVWDDARGEWTEQDN